MATEQKKVPKVKLDLVNRSAEYLEIVRKECMSRVYDKKKIETRLNCRGDQASTLITLAQIADSAPSKQTR